MDTSPATSHHGMIKVSGHFVTLLDIEKILPRYAAGCQSALKDLLTAAYLG